MKIDLTEKEYRTLVETLELANWMLHAHAEEERKDTVEFRDLEQKIFALARDFGMGDEITYDKELEGYFSSKEIEEHCLTYVDEYNNDTFWDELIERMVARDLARHIGEEALEKMSFEEKFEKEEPFRIQYEEEFGQYGIEHLVLKP
ncbi:MAG: hypothetical protein FP816_13470 [Desulfobacteraceae bacterium]|nr:hypothetical protein [Desulfobacteraceae bacterium]